MKLIITLAGTVPDGIPEEELDSLKEALEQELRFSGAYGVTVEVERQ